MLGQTFLSAVVGLTALNCSANPAFGKGVTTCNFSHGECGAFEKSPGSTVKYEKNGAKFTIKEETNAPTIATRKYIFFGRVDVELQAAPGQGIVTAVVLQSDTLDEIDWEWLGGDTKQVQSNYFSKGDITTYDRGDFHGVSEPQKTFHKYSIEWTKNAVNWIIDGNVVRTLKAAEVKGFPESPMQIKLGTWCAGNSQAEEGTVQWAGGLTDFSKAPFDAYYKSVTIVDYAGGNGPAIKDVKEYAFGDKSGSAGSIEINYGSNAGNEDQKSAKEDKPTPASSKETDTAGNLGSQTPSTVPEPNDGLIFLNFTGTPIVTPTPINTDSPETDVPQSAAFKDTIQVGLIAGIILVLSLAI
ncbi:hypothetical protein H9Q72_014185 [Fusarium xylarioides]|uniref:GH16 domain-containing protein n=1 Tax=Fusarium xylarioides TaxID=221167 RepID=A0A9P7HK78_9HYPO|nr:hypothetical protein H9Q70_005521 [Fusarium xylarioides]KAG5757672.1 hypothetical protein H9Q72_014185 [Fusarium xylarioides]KAG5783460.1 hypothetical protein H9Q73_002878 [Fusarium xylarioides]